MNRWFTEQLSDTQIAVTRLDQVHYAGKSEYQVVDVCDLGAWGTTLILDGKVQSSSVDEFIYHESLVHPPLMLHPNPKRVFIGGGGEGATAREILRHKTVERVVMVDIDDIVCKTSKQFLSHHHAGAFENERFELRVEDAKKYLEECEEKFDVMVFDLADPLPGGPCYLLYTDEFYQMAKKKLNPGGIIVTQSGPGGYLTAHEVCVPVSCTLRTVFKHSRTYVAHVPSFSDMYTFCVASDDIAIDVMAGPRIDELIEERLDGTHETVNSAKDAGLAPTGSNLLRFYDGEAHTGMFHLPKWLRVKFETTGFVITKDHPAYIT
eukprot:TRINITY_DN586_c0_g1_i1.p1 TRINITY_DN586_c0_g1~~TRINITY_DN586_c0_g1_i1.p1  ORF type:complete len:342 (-),score=109.10 TRINITY_DN586_c0_g1_i1:236-1198(-)